MVNQGNIIHHVKENVGWIKINRPNALNALSFEMIQRLYQVLEEWKNDDTVAFVCLEGEGDKALCAGGDVKVLYDLRESNVKEYAFNFFSTEYRMNMTMHTYPKPILVYMNGFVMGGGVGISIGATHRIVTEKTKWAMPEMNIGLYPDVGGSYFLNKMPGHIGRYLALTSKPINAADALYIGAADYYINSDAWESIKQAIGERKWSIELVDHELGQLIEKFKQAPSAPSKLAALQNDIDKHFGHERMEDIIKSLEISTEKGDAWAGEIKNILLANSPTSLKVTLKQLIEGKHKSMVDCFKMELELSLNFMESHDFYEGVRAVLVDKDRSPKWSPDVLEKVKDEVVDTFFTYEWKEGKNPL
ncbi:Enoyl-CoA hydratase/carnithine racemase [Natronincola peptidivorans]|uniref:3-hydroxyisobutyryl-CoA hydrolase n=1 Tax=Natronincola peptidivorans TaxID=426128 RepID=A0A1I0GJL4_9FIRM|nr:enoyl-CoA hydratase/isomerase family protein [Natronincola peptidivorans]SET71120.1 Enoyl-CoA hydratase/carnithine racemase [Natronincola peptidivorans]